MQQTIVYALLMFIAGLGIPVMAVLNGILASKFQSPALAATILFLVGFLASVIYLFAIEGFSFNVDYTKTRWYLFLGGILVCFYILSIAAVAPRFGISNAISFVLLGQLVAMSLIDHFGFVGVSQYTLTFQRLMGLILMGTGVFLVVGRT